MQTNPCLGSIWKGREKVLSKRLGIESASRLEREKSVAKERVSCLLVEKGGKWVERHDNAIENDQVGRFVVLT